MASDPPSSLPELPASLFQSSGSDRAFGSIKTALSPPPPCEEVLPSQAIFLEKYVSEPVNISKEITLFKGRVDVADVFGVKNSDLVPGKYEGGLKLWESSADLVSTLKHDMDKNILSFKGKRVLELGCGHGLPGIFACLQGATVVHFQDFNAEVLRCLTIPNVRRNLHQIPKKQVYSLENVMISKVPNTSVVIRYYAGDWGELDSLLSTVEANHQDSVGDDTHGGYDAILMAETVYSIDSLPKLYMLITKCLRRPHGVVYLAAKRYYFGVGGGTRQFKKLVEEDGILEAQLLVDIADGASNVREIWKFSFK